MLSEQHLRVLADGGERRGALIYSDGVLAAVFSQLTSDDTEGSTATGKWYLEAGFGPCGVLEHMQPDPFDTLIAASGWVDAVMAESAAKDRKAHTH